MAETSSSPVGQDASATKRQSAGRTKQASSYMDWIAAFRLDLSFKAVSNASKSGPSRESLH